MSEAEEFPDFRSLRLIRSPDRDFYPGLGEYGLTYSPRGADDKGNWDSGEGDIELVSSVELPRPMDDPEATRWFAESETALEWLADEIGRETAEQFREEVRGDPFYPE